MTTMKQDLTTWGTEYLVTAIWTTLLLMYCKIKTIAPNYYPDWTFINLATETLTCWQFTLILALFIYMCIRRKCTKTQYGLALISITILFVIETELFYAITKALGVW